MFILSRKHHILLASCLLISGVNTLAAPNPDDCFPTSEECASSSLVSSLPEDPLDLINGVDWSVLNEILKFCAQPTAESNTFLDVPFQMTPDIESVSGSSQNDDRSHFPVNFASPSPESPLPENPLDLLEDVDWSAVNEILGSGAQPTTEFNTFWDTPVETTSDTESVSDSSQSSKVSTGKPYQYRDFDKEKIKRIKLYISDNENIIPRQVVFFARNHLKITNFNNTDAYYLISSVKKNYAHIDNEKMQSLRHYISNNPDMELMEILHFAANQLDIHDLTNQAVGELKCQENRKKISRGKYSHIDKEKLDALKDFVANNLSMETYKILNYARDKLGITNLYNEGINVLKSNLTKKMAKSRRETVEQPPKKRAKYNP